LMLLLLVVGARTDHILEPRHAVCFRVMYGVVCDRSVIREGTSSWLAHGYVRITPFLCIHAP
jgi:hypothetical protein